MQQELETIPAIARIVPQTTEGTCCWPAELDGAIQQIEAQGGRVIDKPVSLPDGRIFVYGVKVLVGEETRIEIDKELSGQEKAFIKDVLNNPINPLHPNSIAHCQIAQSVAVKLD